MKAPDPLALESGVQKQASQGTWLGLQKTAKHKSFSSPPDVLFEWSALDHEEVESLLEQVDHEEAGENEDLRHGQPRVREVAGF